LIKEFLTFVVTKYSLPYSWKRAIETYPKPTASHTSLIQDPFQYYHPNGILLSCFPTKILLAYTSLISPIRVSK